MDISRRLRLVSLWTFILGLVGPGSLLSILMLVVLEQFFSTFFGSSSELDAFLHNSSSFSRLVVTLFSSGSVFVLAMLFWITAEYYARGVESMQSVYRPPRGIGYFFMLVTIAIFCITATYGFRSVYVVGGFDGLYQILFITVIAHLLAPFLFGLTYLFLYKFSHPAK